MQSFNQNTIDLVLFDFDGVLVNSEPFYNKLWVRLLEPHCQTFKPAQLTGKNNTQFLSQFNFDSVTIEKLLEQKVTFEKDFFEHQKINPIIGNFLKDISLAHNMGIVSNNTHSNILVYLENNKCENLFKLVVSADNGLAAKPSPEPYVYALTELKNSNDKSLVIEDSLLGLEAAKSAGIKCHIINYQSLEEDITALETYLLNY
jgi:beta-phosphoglucomutase